MNDKNIYKKVSSFLFEVMGWAVTLGLTAFILGPLTVGEKIEFSDPVLRVASCVLVGLLCTAGIRLINILPIKVKSIIGGFRKTKHRMK